MPKKIDFRRIPRKFFKKLGSFLPVGKFGGRDDIDENRYFAYFILANKNLSILKEITSRHPKPNEHMLSTFQHSAIVVAISHYHLWHQFQTKI